MNENEVTEQTNSPIERSEDGYFHIPVMFMRPDINARIAAVMKIMAPPAELDYGDPSRFRLSIHGMLDMESRIPQLGFVCKMVVASVDCHYDAFLINLVPNAANALNSLSIDHIDSAQILIKRDDASFAEYRPGMMFTISADFDPEQIARKAELAKGVATEREEDIVED